MKAFLVGLVLAAGAVHNYAFLFDSTTMPQNPQSFTTSSLCNADDVQSCVTNMTSMINISDPNAIIEYECSDRGKQMLDCLENTTKQCSTLLGSANTQKIVDAMLPARKSLDMICKDKDEYKAFASCLLQFPHELANCTAEGTNFTIDNFDVCQSFQANYKCTVKYINIWCPSKLSYYTKQMMGMYGGVCHLPQIAPQNSSTPMETTEAMATQTDINNVTAAPLCDYDGVLSCTSNMTSMINMSNPNAVIDYECSGEGKKMLDCLDNYTNRCSSYVGADSNVQKIIDSVLPARKSLDMICKNKDDYKALSTCQLRFTDELANCTAEGTNITVDHFDICETIQASYRCMVKYANIWCPSRLPFYTDLMAGMYKGVCKLPHIVPQHSNVLTAMSVPPTAVGIPGNTARPTQSGNTGVQKSLLLQMLTHIEHQAQTMQQFANNLIEEARMAQTLLKSSRK